MSFMRVTNIQPHFFTSLVPDCGENIRRVRQTLMVLTRSDSSWEIVQYKCPLLSSSTGVEQSIPTEGHDDNEVY